MEFARRYFVAAAAILCVPPSATDKFIHHVRRVDETKEGMHYEQSSEVFFIESHNTLRSAVAAYCRQFENNCFCGFVQIVLHSNANICLPLTTPQPPLLLIRTKYFCCNALMLSQVARLKYLTPTHTHTHSSIACSGACKQNFLIPLRHSTYLISFHLVFR